MVKLFFCIGFVKITMEETVEDEIGWETIDSYFSHIVVV